MSVALDITEPMADMLDWFDQHPCSCATIGYIVDEIDWSRETVRQNLKILQAIDAAERLHTTTGLYQLHFDPREDGDA